MYRELWQRHIISVSKGVIMIVLKNRKIVKLISLNVNLPNIFFSHLNLYMAIAILSLTLSPLKPVFMCWMLWHSAHKNRLQWWKG